MQRLQKLSLPLRMVAYAVAAAVVLAVAVGLGVVVALALDSDGVSLQAGRFESISEGLVIVVLLVGIAALVPLYGTLRSSRQELRDQQERLELLREERLALVEELEQESRERRASFGTDAQPAENPERGQEMLSEDSAQAAEQQQEQLRRLEQALRGLQDELDRERRERQRVQRRAEELEREHEKHSEMAQAVQRLQQEHRRLREDLDEEREKLAEAEHWAEGWDQERARLENELQRLREERESQGLVPESRRVGRHLWQRRPALVVGLLFGVLVAWFVSLVVALSLMTP